MTTTIFHNPACGTSRNVLALIRNAGIEPNVVERWPTLRQFVAHRANVQTKPAKAIAADMDLSPGALSRKLNPGEADTARFNVDDLEDYLTRMRRTAIDLFEGIPNEVVPALLEQDDEP